MRLTYLIFSIAIFVGCANSETPPAPAASTARAAIDALHVRVDTVGTAANAASIETTGIVSSDEVAKPGFKIGGIITRFGVEEGDRVRKGQLLATLDQTEVEADREQARLALEKARRDAGRIANLYVDSVATRRQYDDSRTAVSVAERQLEIIDFNRRYSRVYAPIDGRLVRKLANAGEVVGPGQPVAVVQGTAARDWRVQVALTDTEWSRVQEGDAATITLDAYPDRVLSARVTELASVANPAGGTFDAELSLDLPRDLRLAAGLVARVSLTPSSEGTSAALSIPITALAEANNREAVVYRTTPDSRVERRVVRIGPISGDRVAVLDGLQPGDQVVTEGTGWLRDGERVVVVE